jgi:hypothetical protein
VNKKGPVLGGTFFICQYDIYVYFSWHEDSLVIDFQLLFIEIFLIMVIKYKILVKKDSFCLFKRVILEPLNEGNYEPV